MATGVIKLREYFHSKMQCEPCKWIEMGTSSRSPWFPEAPKNVPIMLSIFQCPENKSEYILKIWRIEFLVKASVESDKCPISSLSSLSSPQARVWNPDRNLTLSSSKRVYCPATSVYFTHFLTVSKNGSHSREMLFWHYQCPSGKMVSSGKTRRIKRALP